eukprot:m51a1_g6512 hypothetical protein (111) ;mRNA; f:254488-255736
MALECKACFSISSTSFSSMTGSNEAYSSDWNSIDELLSTADKAAIKRLTEQSQMESARRLSLDLEARGHLAAGALGRGDEKLYKVDTAAESPSPRAICGLSCRKSRTSGM